MPAIAEQVRAEEIRFGATVGSIQCGNRLTKAVVVGYKPGDDRPCRPTVRAQANNVSDVLAVPRQAVVGARQVEITGISDLVPLLVVPETALPRRYDARSAANRLNDGYLSCGRSSAKDGTPKKPNRAHRKHRG
jgi:hypothetical protein